MIMLLIALFLSFFAFLTSLVFGFHIRKSARGAFAVFQQQLAVNNEIQRQLISLSKATAFAISASVRTGSGSSPIRQCCSQHGEELYLWQACDWKGKGFYIEVGAYDGRSLSNSYFFEKLGWDGLLIEAHPELFEKCEQNRTSRSVHAAVGEEDGTSVTFSMVDGVRGIDTLSFVNAPESHLQRILCKGGTIRSVEVPAKTLNSLLEGVDREIDWVSIDVEGGELSVLRGFDLDRFQPRCLLIEDNSGGKDRAIAAYLVKFNYYPDILIGCNQLYARKTIH